MLLGLAFFMAFGQIWAQACDWKKDALEFMDELNAEYRDSSRSPLPDALIPEFKGHKFFPLRSKYAIVAKLERTPNDPAFEMPTSSGITKTFVRYGIATFTLNGVECKLNVYQNLKLAATEEYKNHLFLPFTDLSTGGASYGGGRYIDLCIPDGDSICINFNTAYNPNCAYSGGWNCPIVPRENHLRVKVKAGVKGVTGGDPSLQH
jgi:uncharacterized protein